MTICHLVELLVSCVFLCKEPVLEAWTRTILKVTGNIHFVKPYLKEKKKRKKRDKACMEGFIPFLFQITIDEEE